MRFGWKLTLAVALVLSVLFTSAAVPGTGFLVQTAKGRPLVPVVQEGQAQDRDAQEIALADERVRSALGTGRWEFIDTLPLSAYRPGPLAACVGDACVQAEFFSYTDNALIVATVDLAGRRVVDVTVHPGASPEPNRVVTERAQAVALADPRVQSQVGDATIVANMAPENAWLRGSSCDTPHWCVALTYRVDGHDGTLVVFVDLNEERVAGWTWTPAPAVPEQNLPTYGQPDEVCGTPHAYSQAGWSINYEVQSNDALHVWDVTYNGTPVFQSAKMAQVDVGYANQTWGYHDSVGCDAIVPIYPANTAPVIAPVSGGFVLPQDFRMGGWGGGCAYRYQQWFTFYDDGRVRVSAAAYGRGCGTDAYYTPYLRINVGPGGQAGNAFQVQSASGWTSPPLEGNYPQPPLRPADGVDPYWRVVGATDGALEFTPRWGDNLEPGQPDAASVIALAYHAGLEGDAANLPNMGTGYGCPNNCFPVQWANGESVQDADIVLWYVPGAQTIPTSPYYCWTVSQTETYPCYMGPMTAPVSVGGQTWELFLPMIAWQ